MSMIGEKETYGTIAGDGVSMDGNRNPNPSKQGELQSMKLALQRAEIICDYIGLCEHTW